jgi:hypothetical protein
MPSHTPPEHVTVLTNEDLEIWMKVWKRQMRDHSTCPIYKISVAQDDADHAHMYNLTHFGRAPGQADWIDF